MNNIKLTLSLFLLFLGVFLGYGLSRIMAPELLIFPGFGLIVSLIALILNTFSQD